MHEDAELRNTVAPASLGTASLATLTLLKLLKSRVLSPRALASQTGAVWSKLWECAVALIVQTESASRVCSGLWLARTLLDAAGARAALSVGRAREG